MERRRKTTFIRSRCHAEIPVSGTRVLFIISRHGRNGILVNYKYKSSYTTTLNCETNPQVQQIFFQDGFLPFRL